MPEIEDVRTPGECVKDAAHFRPQRVAAGQQHERIQIPLNGQRPWQLFVSPDRVNGFIQTNCVDPRPGSVSGEFSAGTFRKSDHRHIRMFKPDVRHQSRRRCDYPPLELARSEASGPAVEQLHGFCAGSDLTAQIVKRDRFDPVDDRSKLGGVAIGEPSSFALVAASLTGNHVGCDSPRRAGEPNQRFGWIEAAFHLGNRFVDRVEPGRVGGQLVQISTDQGWRQPRALTRDEGQILPDCEWDDQNIREQDRGIELGKALQRLKRDLSRRIAVVHQIEEAAFVLAQLPVFGEVAPRLAHHPHRRWVAPLTLEHREQRLGRHLIRLRAHPILLPNSRFSRRIDDVIGSRVAGFRHAFRNCQQPRRERLSLQVSESSLMLP